MYCQSCGHQDSQGVQFCSKCGTQLQAAQMPVQEANHVNVFCPHCGKKSEGGGRFCPHCGKSFSANNNSEITKPRCVLSRGNKKRKIVILSSIAAVLLITVVIILVASGPRLSGTWFVEQREGVTRTITFTRFSATEEMFYPWHGTEVRRGTYEISGDWIRFTWKEGFEEWEDTRTFARSGNTTTMNGWELVRIR